MRVVFKLGDPLWRKVGSRRVELELGEGKYTVGQALARLAEMYPEAGADILHDGRSVQERLPYHLFVNHRKIPWSEVDQIPLVDGDQLSLFLIVIGG